MNKLTDSQSRTVLSIVGICVTISLIVFSVITIRTNRKADENTIAITTAAEQQKREAAEQQSRMFRVAVEALAGDGAVFRLDGSGRIAFMNEIAKANFPALQVGGRLDAMIPDEDRISHDEALADALGHESTTIRSLECFPITKDGKRRSLVKTWTSKEQGALAVIEFLDKRVDNDLNQSDSG